MIRFELVTLGGVKFSEEVYEIILPTMEGQIAVLVGHMPLVSVATNGVVKIRRTQRVHDDMMEVFAISGGVIEVANDVLRLLVDEADNASDISEDEAKKAHELAKSMVDNAKDQASLDKAHSLLDRSAVRLQVAGLKRRPKRNS